MIAIEPTQWDVQIDLDSPAAWHTCQKRLAHLQHWHPPARSWRLTSTRSRTPGHRHANLRLRTPTKAIERICLALILGSDPVREMFNFVRVKQRRPMPILFFRPKTRGKRGTPVAI